MRSALLALVVLVTPQPASAEGWVARLTGPRQTSRVADADPVERREAAITLGTHGEAGRAVAVLAAALPSERDPVVRRELLRSLARRGDPAAIPALTEALLSPGTADRAPAASALAAMPTPAALDALVGALERDEVRAHAHAALVRVGRRASPRLVRSLGRPASRLPALAVLSEIGDPSTTFAIAELASSGADAPVVVAALVALREIGDERASPVARARLGDASGQIAAAALRALERVGTRADAPAVAARLASEDPELRRAALVALFQLDRSTAVAYMESALESGDATLADTSVALALESTDPVVLPILFGLLRQDVHAAIAASALAELDGGAGAGVLATVALEPGGARVAATRELAVALRRFGARLGAPERAQGLVALAQATRQDGPARRLTLRAFARDPEVFTAIGRALRSRDPLEQRDGARAAELLGDRALAADVSAALEGARDPELVRRLCAAALALGAEVPLRRLRPHIAADETAPEAMALASERAGARGRPHRRRLGRILRERLRADDPRVRAGAALALAHGGDPSAWRALAAALSDAAPEVRHAAARALFALAAGDARPVIEASARVEEDPVVLDALRLALATTQARTGAARGLPGARALRVRVAATAAEGGHGLAVDVVLPDARWLRAQTLPSGELLLPDLPAGTADVRVRIGE